MQSKKNGAFFGIVVAKVVVVTNEILETIHTYRATHGSGKCAIPVGFTFMKRIGFVG